MRLVAKTFRFDAAHRLFDYEGKCANIHGHTYVVEIGIAGEKLDHNDMVVDFGDLSKLIGKWIDKNWDHAILLNSEDFYCRVFDQVQYNTKRYYFKEQNPTAEVMAEELYYLAAPNFDATQFRVAYVKVWETPTSFATYSQPRVAND